MKNKFMPSVKLIYLHTLDKAIESKIQATKHHSTKGKDHNILLRSEKCD